MMILYFLLLLTGLITCWIAVILLKRKKSSSVPDQEFEENEPSGRLAEDAEIFFVGKEVYLKGWQHSLEGRRRIRHFTSERELRLWMELEDNIPRLIIMSSNFLESLPEEFPTFFAELGIAWFVLWEAPAPLPQQGIPLPHNLPDLIQKNFIIGFLEFLKHNEEHILLTLEERLASILEEESRPEIELLKHLNPVDQKLALLLKEGLLYKEISLRLALSESGVRARIDRLYKKTGVKNRWELISKMNP